MWCNSYSPSIKNFAFPKVSAQALNQFLQQRQTQNENTVIRAVRDWIQNAV
jgi:hypothetical protein